MIGRPGSSTLPKVNRWRAVWKSRPRCKSPSMYTNLNASEKDKFGFRYPRSTP